MRQGESRLPRCPTAAKWRPFFRSQQVRRYDQSTSGQTGCSQHGIAGPISRTALPAARAREPGSRWNTLAIISFMRLSWLNVLRSPADFTPMAFLGFRQDTGARMFISMRFQADAPVQTPHRGIRMFWLLRVKEAISTAPCCKCTKYCSISSPVVGISSVTRWELRPSAGWSAGPGVPNSACAAHS